MVVLNNEYFIIKVNLICGFWFPLINVLFKGSLKFAKHRGVLKRSKVVQTTKITVDSLLKGNDSSKNCLEDAF